MSSMREVNITFPVPDDDLIRELNDWKRKNPVLAYCQQFLKKEE